ncbi:hypothetical protein [Streptomyces sp. NPDC002187]|uniref:hypothetical protein n=1 Tax=Streptomyces sp. NPDC002187 TaxID=3364637 RepID=UPI003690A2A9
MPGEAGGYAQSYQQAYAEIAATHRARPMGEIPSMLRRAADVALLEFTESDLLAQARAISAGEPYELRGTVT